MQQMLKQLVDMSTSLVFVGYVSVTSTKRLCCGKNTEGKEDLKVGKSFVFYSK